MAIGIIGWDQDGMPIYGDTGASGGMKAPNNTVQGDASGSTQTQPTPVSGSVDPRSVTQQPMAGPDPTGGGAFGGAGYTGYTMPSTNANPAWINYTSSQNDVDRILKGLPALETSGNNAKADINTGLDWQHGAIDTVKNAGETAASARDAVLAGQRGNTAGANANGQNLVNQQGQIYGALGGMSLGANATHNSEMDALVAGLKPYQNIGYDPAGLAAQNQALSNFSNIQGGSLDYQASQAQAAHAQAVMAAVQQYNSNPHDVAQQQDAIDKLRGAIDGGEWADNLGDVRDKYKSLSDPEITDQERFIMENLRQQSEARMRGNREALNADLQTRGIRSGASEMVGLGMENQETGNERVLTELGAGANAVNRSMQAMQGWADTSAMGRQAELQAMGMYSDAAGNLRQMNDNVGMFNAAEVNQTNRVNATNSTNVNISNAANDTNVSMFNAGQQNQAKANNQATRLAGAQGYSTAATNLRNSNEAINMFNKDQEMVQGRHIDQVTMDASNSKLNGTNQTVDTVGRLVGQQTTTALDENNMGWARTTRDNDTAGANVDKAYGGTRDWGGMAFDYGGNLMNSGIAKNSIDMSTQGAKTAGTVAAAGIRGDATRLWSGQKDTDAAMDLAMAAGDADNGLGFLNIIPGVSKIKW